MPTSFFPVAAVETDPSLDTDTNSPFIVFLLGFVALVVENKTFLSCCEIFGSTVISIVAFKNKKYKEVLEDLKEICRILPTKVIIGSGYLTDEEIKKASEIVKEAGAICVKTATTADPLDNSELDEKAKHLRIMRESAPGILVKASGGIKTLSNVKKMVKSGADIIGTSSGAEIVNEATR